LIEIVLISAIDPKRLPWSGGFQDVKVFQQRLDDAIQKRTSGIACLSRIKGLAIGIPITNNEKPSDAKTQAAFSSFAAPRLWANMALKVVETTATASEGSPTSSRINTHSQSEAFFSCGVHAASSLKTTTLRSGISLNMALPRLQISQLLWNEENCGDGGTDYHCDPNLPITALRVVGKPRGNGAGAEAFRP
jgi:hypothetical protein